MAVKKVLCVDDSTTDLANIKEICGNAGYEVMTATHGEEAVARAESELSGAILLDVVMKPLNGFQTCRRIAENPATAHIPIIPVSSKGNDTDKMRGEEQGAKGYTVKPFVAEQILHELAKF